MIPLSHYSRKLLWLCMNHYLFYSTALSMATAVAECAVGYYEAQEELLKLFYRLSYQDHTMPEANLVISVGLVRGDEKTFRSDWLNGKIPPIEKTGLLIDAVTEVLDSYLDGIAVSPNYPERLFNADQKTHF